MAHFSFCIQKFFVFLVWMKVYNYTKPMLISPVIICLPLLFKHWFTFKIIVFKFLSTKYKLLKTWKTMVTTNIYPFSNSFQQIQSKRIRWYECIHDLWKKYPKKCIFLLSQVPGILNTKNLVNWLPSSVMAWWYSLEGSSPSLTVYKRK